MISSVAEMEDKDTHNYQGDTKDPDQTLPVILKKESEQLGMLEYITSMMTEGKKTFFKALKTFFKALKSFFKA